MKRRIQLVVAVLGVAGMFAGTATAATSPTVASNRASAVKEFSATLHGTVNPNGNSTTYYFQYGLTTAYGVNTAVSRGGSGTKPVSVKASATGLIPGTTYHYRVVADNRFGTSVGGDRTFTTAGPPPPTAATGPAAKVTANAATLTGVINPNGAVTSYRFNYGTTTGYGSESNTITVAASKTPQIVAYQITGLAKETIFHYQLVAFHGSKVISTGADQVFMTLPSPRAVPTLTQHTSPGLRRHKPYVFTTRGRVVGPSAIPAQFDCTGYVAVRFFFGHRDLTYLLVPVAPDCTYSATTTINRLPGTGSPSRHVAVTVQTRFHGNGYLTPRRGRIPTVTLG